MKVNGMERGDVLQGQQERSNGIGGKSNGIGSADELRMKKRKSYKEILNISHIKHHIFSATLCGRCWQLFQRFGFFYFIDFVDRCPMVVVECTSVC